MNTHRLSYGAGSIAYVERREARGGAKVVLVHAFPLNRTMWEPQLRALAGRHEVVALDLRGFGESDPFDGTLSMETAAADVAAVMDRAGFDRAVVCGVSMGGYVALALARASPERLAGLVLADTKAAGDGAKARAGRFELIETVRSKGPAAIADAMLPKLLSERARSERPDLVAAVRGMIEATPAGAIEAALRGMAGRADSRDLLGEIAVPTLVVVGTEDAVTPRADATEMAAGIPAARLVAIEGAGHLSNLEAPDEFSRALGDFLDELRPD
jgi:3-oxoadipate enol-lactonase